MSAMELEELNVDDSREENRFELVVRTIERCSFFFELEMSCFLPLCWKEGTVLLV